MSHKTAFLGKEPIFPLLLKMSIPAAVGMLVNALYNIVDTIFVGQGVGPNAIAALTIVFPIQMLISSFAQAIGFGAASILSRRLGEKKYDDAAAAIGTAYSIVFIVTLVFIVCLFIFMDQVLIFFGVTPTIMPLARDYLRIIGFGLIFFAMSMTANSLVRAEGNAKASMNSMVLGAVINCILDPIFIFVLHWGVKGAAVATIISQFASCLYILFIYVMKHNHVELEIKHFKIRRDLVSESFILGIPAFIQQAGMCILAIVMNNSLRYYGGDIAITAFGMVHKFNSIIILPIVGVTQGFQPIAGYNFGARDLQRVRKSLYVTILTATVVGLFGAAIALIFPRQCMSMFTHDDTVLALSRIVLMVICSLIPLAAIQITGTTYFQAVGKPIPALILGLTRQFIILIPLVFILPFIFGLNGLWFAYPAADLFSTIITVIFLIISVKKLNRIDENMKYQSVTSV